MSPTALTCAGTPGLAVFAEDLGASFIDKHLIDLAPNRTVAVGRTGAIDELAQIWRVRCPVFETGRFDRSLPIRLARRAGLQLDGIEERLVERFLRKHGVSVVLGEYLDQFLRFVPLMERLSLPYVVQGHGIDVSARLREPGMVDRIGAYKSARAILTRCEHHRHRLIGLGLKAESIFVNPGGVDIPDGPIERPQAARFRILAIGVMVPKKAPIYLLEAFRRAAAREPRLTLDYVGGGPLFEAARQFVGACGLVDRVRLHGVAPEEVKQKLILSCGTFAQHSMINPTDGDEEGLPAAIQEAMAHAMAVVSTRHSGIPEAVEHGATGILVEEGDVEAMAQAILQTVETSAALGRRGYEKARTFYSREAEAARLKEWLFGDRDRITGAA